MSHQMQRYRNGNIGPQEEWGNEHNPQAQCHPPPVNFFQGEIQRLSALLEMEREKWFKENQKVAYLQTELAETQFQWRRQKSLKEMYINKEKETKSKLERIDRFSDPATLDPAVIASKVHNDMKYKKKKLLQKDFEELKVALILNQEAFTSQIQAEKEKNNVLQKELDKLETSYEELRSKCEVDVAAGRQQAQVQTFCEEKIGEDPQLLEKLRAAKDDLHQKMSQEIAFLQEREQGLQRELDQIKVSYQELDCKHEKEVSALKQQVDTYQQEINRKKNANLERANKDLQPNNPNAEKDDLHQKMSQEIVFLKEKEEYLESELQQVKDFHQELLGVYERDVAKLKEEVETYQKELNRMKTANSNRAMKDFQLTNKLRDDNTYLYSTMSEKIEILQQQLEETESHLDQNEKDNSALRQQVKNFQQQIIQEKKAHLETAKTDLTLLNSMRTEQDDLKENMSKVIAFLQERENGFQRELDQIKVSYQELNFKYEKEVSALKQQVDTYQKHLDREKKENSQRANKDLQLINKLRDEKVHLQKTLLEHIEILQQKSEEPENDNSELRKHVENLQLQIIQEKKVHLETAKKDLTLLNTMRTEQDNLRETMLKEIAFWQEKEKRLKGEMDKIEILYQELQSRYKTDVSALKQQAETFKKEINKNLKTANKNLELINNLQVEKDDLQQKVTVLQQTSSDGEICLKPELENVKTELENQIRINTKLSAELEDRDELNKQKRKSDRWTEPRQQKESIPIEDIFDLGRMDLNLSVETLSDISEFTNVTDIDIMGEFRNFSTNLDSELMKKTETVPEKLDNPEPKPMEEAGKETELTLSAWKRIRHALGLRKPKKWKKNNNTYEATN